MIVYQLKRTPCDIDQKSIPSALWSQIKQFKSNGSSNKRIKYNLLILYINYHISIMSFSAVIFIQIQIVCGVFYNYFVPLFLY